MIARCKICSATYDLTPYGDALKTQALPCSRCGNTLLQPPPKPPQATQGKTEAVPTSAKAVKGSASLSVTPMVNTPPIATPPPMAAPADTTTPDAQRYRLRLAGGLESSCQDEALLQRLVIEGRLQPTDEVSIDGGAWQALSSLPQLAPFFAALGRPTASLMAAAATPTAPPTQATRKPPTAPTNRSKTPEAPPEKPKPLWKTWALTGAFLACGALGIGVFAAGGPSPTPNVSTGAPSTGAQMPTPTPRDLPPPQHGYSAGGSPTAPGTTAATPLPAADQEPQLRLPDQPWEPPSESKTTSGARPAAMSAATPTPASPQNIAGARDDTSPQPVVPPGTYARLLRESSTLRRDGKARQALQKARKAAALQKQRPEAYLEAGWSYLALRRPNKAVANFEHVLSLNPNLRAAHFGLGEAFDQKGLRQKAIQAYRRFLKQQPRGQRAKRARQALRRLQ